MIYLEADFLLRTQNFWKPTSKIYVHHFWGSTNLLGKLLFLNHVFPGFSNFQRTNFTTPFRQAKHSYVGTQMTDHVYLLAVKSLASSLKVHCYLLSEKLL